MPKTGIEVHLGLWVDTADLAEMIGRCQSLADEFGGVAAQIERWPRESSRPGFVATLYCSAPWTEGETAAQAMRSAVKPVAAKHGLNDEYLDFFGDPEKDGYANLWFYEQEFDGYVLFLVLAAHGGADVKEAQPGTREDFTEAADTDLIATVRRRFPGAGLGTALGQALPIAESIGASGLQFQASESSCEVVLFAVRPVVDGENLETSLRRIGETLADQLDVPPNAVVLRGAGEDLVGALEPDRKPVATLRPRTVED
ncbi:MULTISPECIES: hypothetical protein [Actinomycetes]|uniref:hypothetical protein n=1 Tax=Actinomycetes TaxID=1760 RepID=UPI000316D165|nr:MULTISPECIES: hypothetical protein [Actinomycetes]